MNRGEAKRALLLSPRLLGLYRHLQVRSKRRGRRAASCMAVAFWVVQPRPWHPRAGFASADRERSRVDSEGILLDNMLGHRDEDVWRTILLGPANE